MEPENTFHLKKKPPFAIRPSSPVEEIPRSPHGNPVSSFSCQEFTITLKNKKKSRADSLKSQRHPALEDKFDHCIT